MKLIHTYTVMLLTLLIGCSSGKPVESFLMTEGRTLYFVRPTQLTGKDVDVIIDFTHNTTPNKNVLCNFTVESSEINTNTVSSLVFIINSSKDTITTTEVKQLFREEEFTRYTSTITPTEFKNMLECFANDDCKFSINLHANKQAISLSPSSTFKKSAKSAQKILTWE